LFYHIFFHLLNSVKKHVKSIPNDKMFLNICYLCFFSYSFVYNDKVSFVNLYFHWLVVECRNVIQTISNSNKKICTLQQGAVKLCSRC